ncbi:MAG: hypothetical protein HeimC3_46940, partial [Candidatus Heimdallarchaeota archaeon LC_3]
MKEYNIEFNHAIVYVSNSKV